LRKLLSAPVLNDDGTVLGVLDLQELVSVLVSPLSGASGSNDVDVRLQLAKETLNSHASEQCFAILDARDKCSRAVELFAHSCHR
jgi:hypothetical protein